MERHGVYIDFISAPGFDLVVKSLEAIRSGIRLLNVRKQQVGDEEQTLATVYVPHNQRSYFLNRIRAYAEEQTRGGKPKHASLINSISDIRRSVLESFWQDARELLPGDDLQWIEVWLSNDQDSVVERFGELLRQQNIEQAEGVLRFPERSVRVIHANRAQVEFLIEASDDIAELRLAKEVASVLIQMENRDQLEKVKELLARTQFDGTQSSINGGGEVVLYEEPNGQIRLDVRLEQDTVWLAQAQMAELFDKNVRTISEHIRNVFKEKELDNSSVIRNFRITARDGKAYDTQFYNLGERVRCYSFSFDSIEHKRRIAHQATDRRGDSYCKKCNSSNSKMQGTWQRNCFQKGNSSKG